MSEKIINAEMNLGDVIAKYPETEPIFQKYFGNGCFTCPGAKVESISFGAMMHNMDAQKIVEELNAVVGKK